MKVSVVIPAHNEADVIAPTVTAVVAALADAGRDYEIVVVDDASTDGTGRIVQQIAADNPRVRCLRSHYSNGYGLAVRAGLDVFAGDAVAIVMGDGSDDPLDLVRYFDLIEEGYDCAFGSRFVERGRVHDYPRFKLVVNRLVNAGIRMIFRHGYDDTTNAFKAYRREVVHNVAPLVSHHFNLTVELPLKAIVRGHSYAVIPISWTNRAAGESKLGLREMGSRYAYITLMVWLEHHLARGDYRRHDYRDHRPAAREAGSDLAPPRRLRRRAARPRR
ncbi:MAG: dolichol-phosphate mannosyltransferase [Solirubrobacteraceae bacterium]|jgi:dolichol-phosphate mannosyltransferase|nr:dolichol-phosphate mannosyltransferase [Solirubrobacteraceae bacterium]